MFKKRNVNNVEKPLSSTREISKNSTRRTRNHSDLQKIIQSSNSSKQSVLPKKISGIYQNDYNILWVHRVIMDSFANERKNIDKYKRKILEHEKILENAITIISKNRIKGLIQNERDKIENILNNTKEKEYLSLVSDILQEYKSTQPECRVIKFGSEEKEEEVDDDILETRLLLIAKYLDIAKDYYDIDVRRVVKQSNICNICESDLDEVGTETESGIECACGYEYILYTSKSVYKDTSRLESNRSSVNYLDRENFEKAIDNFGCKQEDKIPKSLYEAVDNHMKSYGMMSSEEIRQMPLNEDGSRGNTSMTLLCSVLKSVGYPEYYKDHRLILHNLWGWEKKDISHIKDVLMCDYDKTQKVFNSLKKDRSSSINVQYRLFRHLQANGYPCTIDDFRVSATPNILDSHDAIWSLMCKGCNYPLILKRR